MGLSPSRSPIVDPAANQYNKGMKTKPPDFLSVAGDIVKFIPLIWFAGFAVMFFVGLISLGLRAAFGIPYIFDDLMGSGREVFLLVGLGPLLTVIILALPVSLLMRFLPKWEKTPDDPFATAVETTPVKEAAPKTTSSKKYWKCSGCGSIMTKKEGAQLLAGLAEVNVSGGYTCNQCLKRHDAAAVYAGKYDFRCDDSVIEQMLADPDNAVGDSQTKTWTYKGRVVE